MARPDRAGELSSAAPTTAAEPTPYRAPIRFAVAGAADDAAIRRLLRENPTRGAVSVSFEREPCFFAAPAGPTTEDTTIVAYDRAGGLVCMGRCTVRPRQVNGRLRRVGYLGELRLAAHAAPRLGILRGGYRFFHDRHAERPADLYFTSIAADNTPARRLLERGLPGLPRYTFLTEFVTVLIPVGRATVTASHASPAEATAHFNAHGAHRQLAAAWSEDELAGMQDRLALRDRAGTIVAAAALGDQRGWRQTVVRGYTRGLALARPFVNLAAAFGGGVHLPAIGAVLPLAFLSPLAVAPGGEERLPELVRAAFAPARRRGVQVLALGFDAADPQLAIVRGHFRRREYRSRLYQVSWPDEHGVPLSSEHGRFQPDLGLL